MRFSPIILLLFAMLGCGSDSKPPEQGAESTPPEQVENSPPEQVETPKSPEEEAAIAAIEELGGRRYMIGDESLAHSFSGISIMGVGWERIKRMKGWEVLEFRRTKVTDAGLVHLKGLTSLEGLNLNGTKVSDAGLVHLKGMTKLKILNLNGTQITDAGLVHLKGLTKLRRLLLPKQVTDEGVKKFQATLPKCRILH